MPVGKPAPQIILGVDPGIADTGYGLIVAANNSLELIAYGSIKTAKQTALAERLLTLESELAKIIRRYQPVRAGVEELFFYNNAKTAFVVGQARGVILLTLKKNKLPILELTPLQVKQGITGYGQADKRQVQQLVKTLLRLDQIPQPDDAADALAVAIVTANTNQL